MKSFKFFFSAILLAVFIFTGCNKNDNPTEPNDDSGGNSFSISGTLQVHFLGDFKIQLAIMKDSAQVTFVAGESDLDNNSSFNIKTVKDIPSDLLEPITNDLPEGLTISNTNVKGQGADLYLIDKNGNAVYEVTYQGNYDSSAFFVQYLFLDSDVKIQGSGNDPDEGPFTFDVNAKKGWNKIFLIFDMKRQTTTITTNDPHKNGKWVAEPLGGSVVPE